MPFQRVKQFKDLELSYDAPSGLALHFWTDMPGSAMADRVTLSFPATSGRQTKTLPLAAGGAQLEGTLYKCIVSSTGVVRLFGGIVRARPIGVYFDGAAGETWETQESGVGI
jgi:hypothetical protein